MTVAELSNIITKPSHKKPRLTLKGFAAIVKRIRRRSLRIKELEEANREDKNALIKECHDSRIEEEKNGKFYKNCVVDGGNQDPVRITFTNKFRTIEPHHEKNLRSFLGELFSELFEIKTTLKVTDKDKIEELQNLLGKEKFYRIFDATTVISTRTNFMEKRSKLRPLMEKDMNAGLDKIIDEIQHQPLFSTK